MTKYRWLRPFILVFMAGSLLMGGTGCQKDQISSGSSLSVYSSTDSINFEQVFTTEVQPTKTIKLFNGSADQQVTIQNIRLGGGENSPFKINVNGQPGSSFSSISLAGDDSLYVFVTVSLPEHQADGPFGIIDSLEYQYGNRTDKILLYATGLNAYYLKAGNISRDTTWTNKRPIVLNGTITVASATTLHIEPGTKIYTKAGKGIRVNGRLEALGTYDSSGQILMTGSRLDKPYDGMPGSWQGISFGPQSKNNKLRYVQIQNAVNALTDTSKSINNFDVNSSPEVVRLEGCIIMQSSHEGLLLRHSSATLTNCLIYNCGIGLRAMGGKYTLNYLTMAGYSNDLIYHTDPLLYLADHNESGIADPLNFSATNCIFTGDNDPLDEIFLENQTGAFTLAFKNSLIKAANLPPFGSFKDCLLNIDPAFVLIDNRRAEYDFQLLNISEAIGKAIPINGITDDLLHQVRSTTASTMGCYEFKEAATL